MKRLLLALIAVTLHAQNTNTVTIIPDAADANLGKLRFIEKRANGSNYIDVIGQAALSANQTITLPNLTGKIVLEEADSVVRISNLDVSGTGFGAFANVRHLAIKDLTGLNGYWDMYSLVQSGLGGSSFAIRDNSGASAIEFYRAVSGVAVDYAHVFIDLIPDTNGSQKLGSSSQRWANSYFQGLDVAGSILPDADQTRDIGSDSPQKWWNNAYIFTAHVSDLDLHGFTIGSLRPSVTATDDLGSPSKQYRNLYISGTCSGCSGVQNVLSTSSVNTTFDTAIGLSGSAEARIDFTNTAAPTDQKKWRFIEDTSGTMHFQSLDDAYTSGSEVFVIGRSGTSVTGLAMSTEIYPAVSGTVDMGKSANRWGVGYFNNIDAAPAGSTTNYALLRHLGIVDMAGGLGYWDMQAFVSTGGGSSLKIRDNLGADVINFVRATAGVPQNYADVSITLAPTSTGAADLGTTGKRWNGLYVVNADFSGTVNAGSYYSIVPVDSGRQLGGGGVGQAWQNLYVGSVLADSDVTPSVTNTASLGAFSKRWGAAHIKDLTVYGTCTGCGTGVSSVTGTSPIASSGGTTPAISCPTCVVTSGTQSIAGLKTFTDTMTLTSGFIITSASIGGNYNPSASNTYSIGTSTNRMSTVYTSGLNQGAGTSIGVTGHLFPAAANTYYLGDLTHAWQELDVRDIFVFSSMSPNSNNSVPLGQSGLRWSTIYTTNFNVSGAVTAPSGSSGVSGSISCGGSSAVNLTVSGGIITAMSCI